MNVQLEPISAHTGAKTSLHRMENTLASVHLATSSNLTVDTARTSTNALSKSDSFSQDNDSIVETQIHVLSRVKSARTLLATMSVSVPTECVEIQSQINAKVDFCMYI